MPSPGDLPNPGIKPRSPTLQSLYHVNHQGRTKNTGVGSLALLQRILGRQRKINIIRYHIYVKLKKNNTNEFIYKTSRLMDIENKLMVTKVGGGIN